MTSRRDTASGPSSAAGRTVSRRPGLAPVTWLGASAPESAAPDNAAPGNDARGNDAPGIAARQNTGGDGGADTTELENPETGRPAAETASDRRARRAENVSMHALTRRGMSRHELEKTLVARELEPDEVAAELERLEGVGLIDDAALAETIVRTQHERKGLGRSALVAELRRRHIDQEHISVALEQLDDDDEMERAKELAVKRAPQLRSVDHETAVRRLTGYLMRKGYASGVVRTAVAEALAGAKGGSDTVRFR